MAELNVKIKKAYFLHGIIEGNPCPEYIKYIVFPWFNEFNVERKEENDGAKLFYMDPVALSRLHSIRLFGARFPSILKPFAMVRHTLDDPIIECSRMYAE
ncbi:hypothetical protein Tco_1266246 [Tanacetum coccineum]